MINETFLNRLKLVELAFIQAFIYILTSDKITPDTTNSENIESTVSRCPHCGSFHFVKMNLTKPAAKVSLQKLRKNIQRYNKYHFFSYKEPLLYMDCLYRLRTQSNETGTGGCGYRKK